MRIAILGTRGIPANYGGFETFAEKLSTRLSLRGHDVTVYCRSHHVDSKLKEFEGVHLTTLPTVRQKYLDTVVHTMLSAFHAIRRFDVILLCNAANSPFIPIVTWTGTPTAVNVDGLERKRKKWNWLGRLYYRLGERASVWFATEVVTDAKAIQDYYRTEYGKASTMITYGAEVERFRDGEVLAKFGLESEKYFLYVSRLEPENNADLVIRAFRNVRTDRKLVVVGDAPYAADYRKKLFDLAEGDKRIVFTGFVFGEGYKTLQQNAYAYVHATEVGGTHPALIEAMGYGNCVLTLSTLENDEVVADTAIKYRDVEGLTDELQRLSARPDLILEHRERAQARVRENYSWDAITDQYENLFKRLAK